MAATLESLGVQVASVAAAQVNSTQAAEEAARNSRDLKIALLGLDGQGGFLNEFRELKRDLKAHQEEDAQTFADVRNKLEEQRQRDAALEGFDRGNGFRISRWMAVAALVVPPTLASAITWALTHKW